MNKLLVPTDFSECASNALRFATRLNTPIMLMSAYLQPSAAAPVPLSVVKEDNQERVNELYARLSDLSEVTRTAGVNCDILAVEGMPGETIVSAAVEQGVDLLVMGSQGENTLSGAILGSTTTHVIEKANCPVLVVPFDYQPDTPIRQITYATNYAEGDKASIAQTASIAKQLGASVLILHVAENEEAMEQERQRLNAFKQEILGVVTYPKISFELKQGNVEAVIMAQMVAGTTDLLALNTRHRGFWGRLFGHSLTRDLTMTAHLPVLAFHHWSVGSPSILNFQLSKWGGGSRNRKKWFKETARDFLCGRVESIG